MITLCWSVTSAPVMLNSSDDRLHVNSCVSLCVWGVDVAARSKASITTLKPSYECFTMEARVLAQELVVVKKSHCTPWFTAELRWTPISLMLELDLHARAWEWKAAGIAKSPSILLS